MKDKIYKFLIKRTSMETLITACMTTFLVAVAVIFVWLLALCGGWSNLVDTVKFAQLMSIADRVYIGEADTKQVSDAAYNAMISSLGDRWSYYLDEKEYEEYMQRQNNQYTGVGITLQQGEGTWEILAVAENSPAAKAGIVSGMCLVEVNGVRLTDETVTDIAEMMRENPEHVTLVTSDAEGYEHTFELAMEVIYSNPISFEMKDGNIGYVRIENFDETCGEQGIAAVDSLIEQGAVGLIFDVRSNGGGYVHEMCELVDRLLPEGEIFVSVSEDGKETITESDDTCVALPMVVLVNEDSYSAAEFFAAVLDEYDAATVVGAQTTGKNRSQTTLKLIDGSAVHISSKRYLTPNRVDLTEQGGLTPEIIVENGETDRQLEAALKIFER